MSMREGPAGKPRQALASWSLRSIRSLVEMFFRQWIPATNTNGFIALGTTAPSGIQRPRVDNVLRWRFSFRLETLIGPSDEKENHRQRK
jgi:hypothetical protein